MTATESAAPAPRPVPVEATDQPAVNRLLDAAATATSVLGREAPPFRAMGVAGLAAGAAVIVALSIWEGPPVGSVAAAAVGAFVAFVAAGLVRTRLGMTARHVAVPDLLLGLAAAAAVAAALGESVPRTLDVLAVGIVTFIAWGRMGCLLSGCCHGRPCSVGIRYPPGASVDEALVGIRLFPVQVLDAGWILLVTVVAIAMSTATRPGETAWWVVLGYGAGRFVLEFLRGDLRRKLGPLSTTQWLVLALLAGRIAVEEARRDALDVRRVAVIATAALVATLLYAARSRWMARDAAPFGPERVPAWMAAVGRLEAEARRQGTPPGEVVTSTPVPGITLALLVDSAGEDAEVYSYAVRSRRPPVDERVALGVAGVLAQHLREHRILAAGPCRAGSFHLWLLVRREGPIGSVPEDPPEMVALRARAFAAGIRRAVRESPEVEFGLHADEQLAPDDAPPEGDRMRYFAPHGTGG